MPTAAKRKQEVIPPSRAVATHRAAPSRAVRKGGSPANMLEVIARASADPTVDVAKMQALLNMQRDLINQQAKSEFTAALIKAQKKLPVIGKRGVIVIEKHSQRTPYARFEDINRVVKPILAAEGLALRFHTGSAADGKLTVTAILSHTGGHEEQTTLPLPHDPSGSKNSVQAVGSAVSYGKRYTMTAILNLIAEEEDDDGNLGKDTPITEAEMRKLLELMENAGLDKGRFCEAFGIKEVAALPAARLQEAKDRIAQYKRSAMAEPKKKGGAS